MSRRALGLAVVAVGLVACSTQESSTPRPTLTVPAPTTTPTTTTTTVVATSTTGATTTTAVSTTTTTTTTLPAAPAATSIPIIVGGGAEGWLFLGVWNVDEWRSAIGDGGDPIDTDLTGGGANPLFAVNALGRPETTARLGPNVEVCPDGRTGPTVDVEFDAPEPPGFGYTAIAVPAADRVRKPRPIAVVPGGAAVYQDLGEAAIDAGPDGPSLGSVEQTVVTDLDGDGDDEALVVFEHVPDGAAPGDFAALLLVDTSTRSSTTVARSTIERFRVLDVLDLNGDGRMEVVVHVWDVEGDDGRASVVVYEYDGADGLTEVLANGCGA